MIDIDHEKEARVNALKQLLATTLPEVIAAYEGQSDAPGYEELKARRAAWKAELDELQGNPAAVSEPTPDVLLTTLSNRKTAVLHEAQIAAESARKDFLEDVLAELVISLYE